MQWIQMLLEFIFDLFFGCRHAHLTRPFTIEARSYEICLDCGKEMPYSLQHMRLLRPWEIARHAKTYPGQVPADLPALSPALVAAAMSTNKPYADWKAVA